MIGWNFPSNGGGQIRGIAEAGIETFTGKEISSLARETCQNSLDAAANENFAVTVEFYRHEIFSKDIPGCDDFKDLGLFLGCRRQNDAADLLFCLDLLHDHMICQRNELHFYTSCQSA